MGNLHKCGRCQAQSLGAQSAYVTNAPPRIFRSWCHDCIIAVNGGAPAILYGVSIDPAGDVIRDSSPVSVPKSPKEKLKSVFEGLMVFSVLEGGAALLMILIGTFSLVFPNPNGTDSPTDKAIFLGLCSICLARAVLVLIQLKKMESCKAYGRAMLTAFLAMIPIGFCFPFSAPYAVWTIFVLRDPEVRNLF